MPSIRPNTKARMISANSYAEILYEVAEAVSGLIVHSSTVVYAPGLSAQKVHPKLLATALAKGAGRT